jgi:hypothetical protein
LTLCRCCQPGLLNLDTAWLLDGLYDQLKS